MAELEDDIVETVDNLADEVEEHYGRVAQEAKRLGLSERELAERIANELTARNG